MKVIRSVWLFPLFQRYWTTVNISFSDYVDGKCRMKRSKKKGLACNWSKGRQSHQTEINYTISILVNSCQSQAQWQANFFLFSRWFQSKNLSVFRKFFLVFTLNVVIWPLLHTTKTFFYCLWLAIIWQFFFTGFHWLTKLGSQKYSIHYIAFLRAYLGLHG